jgi:hypothetical protein
MMRKTTFILLGAAAGAVMTLLATHSGMISIGSTTKVAVDDTYRQAQKSQVMPDRRLKRHPPDPAQPTTDPLPRLNQAPIL